MYVILTSRPGLFRTEIRDGVYPLRAYDYYFYDSKKAHFVIAELLDEHTKIRLVDEAEIVNDIPCKFFPKFETIEKAVSELQHLTAFGHMDATLREAPATVQVKTTATATDD